MRQASSTQIIFNFLSNGRFKNADHQAVVNSNCSRVSIATFQYPAPDAVVYPLVVKKGERPVMDEAIRYLDMYKRKMGRYQELEELKNMTRKKSEQEGTTSESVEAGFNAAAAKSGIK